MTPPTNMATIVTGIDLTNSSPVNVSPRPKRSAIVNGNHKTPAIIPPIPPHTAPITLTGIRASTAIDCPTKPRKAKTAIIYTKTTNTEVAILVSKVERTLARKVVKALDWALSIYEV
jgi:hypothetical protein